MFYVFFFLKQKTEYEMRISDWSSDVCSSDLTLLPPGIETLGVRVFRDMRAGLSRADVIVMLRLQNERMGGALLPSAQEFNKYYGLTAEKIGRASCRERVCQYV